MRVDAAGTRTLERAGLIAKRFSAPSASAQRMLRPLRAAKSEVQRFLAAQQQMSDAINAHLGFRGYMMMMRLQRAANLRDLHDLLPDFAQALVKRLGVDAATPIVTSLQQLITQDR